MGWSWAFWFVEQAHLELVRRAGVPTSRLALGGWPVPDVRQGPVEIPFSDNVTCVATTAAAAEEMRDRVLLEFERA
eukprot:1625141-Lingulodinium_polyedra.AAC.1